MRPKDNALAESLNQSLDAFDRDVYALPGIDDPACREAFVEQLVESIRRIKYFELLSARISSKSNADHARPEFDPLRAAIWYAKHSQLDEASWLVFLAIHFGKHHRGGWRYLTETYGALGETPWNWKNVSSNVTEFRRWLQLHKNHISRKTPAGGFGNHRKYQSLDGFKLRGTGHAVESYVNWINSNNGHQSLFTRVLGSAKGDRKKAFATLYTEMSCVASFGRLAKFDYLTMLAKVGIADIEADSTYISSSTGPISGARLLFGKKLSGSKFDELLIKLDNQLNVGMQVLEDALCNWQKSPAKFIAFRG